MTSEAGTVWINPNLVPRPDTPVAGPRQSGFGVENGVDDMLEFMAPQSLYVPTARFSIAGMGRRIGDDARQDTDGGLYSPALFRTLRA